MREFAYRHSRGATKFVVGRGLDVRSFVGGRAVYLVDANSGVEFEDALVLGGGEEVKSLEVLTKVYEHLMSRGADRSTYLVAVGGGALLDLATFAAGTYMRGMRLALVPTTLLAMIDAAVGGKGAVDWGRVKNLVGVFYQPDVIIADLRFVDRLPDRVYASAFAEAVKYGVTLDGDLFAWLKANAAGLRRRDGTLLEEAVYRCAKIKASVVEEDEFETKGVRQVLNFGHTVGHAVERLLGLLHGEAVSVGMAVEGAAAVEAGLFKEAHLDELLGLLTAFGLPTKVCLGPNDVEEAKRLVERDKKRRGDRLLMPVPTDIGRWVLEEVPLESVKRVIERLRCPA
ncbi:MAG: 3-dehydroquinate synthase [Thermoproteus sp.]